MTEGGALRIFPRTAIRYKLPDGAGRKSLRAILAPVAGTRVAMTTTINAGSIKKTYSLPVDGSGLEIDLDLGSASEIEIIADATGAISYPCGIELRNAFIVEGPTP